MEGEAQEQEVCLLRVINDMDARFIYGTEENKEYLKNLRDELLEFGVRFPSEGGSSYYLGDDGTPWKDRNRETWITSRMVHVYSIGSMLYSDNYRKKIYYKKLAEKGLKGLTGELKDMENGGWYAGIIASGEILPNKQCYAHAFVILAASSAMLAGIQGASELLDEALTVFDRFFWDEKKGLTKDTWNTEFTICDSYRGLNANMHTVEAFLAVADATGREEYRERAGRIIDRVIKWAEENNYRIPEHYTEEWIPDLEHNFEKKDDPFKPYGATPGHGIEWARLITQWAESTFKDEEISKDGICHGKASDEELLRNGYEAGTFSAGGRQYYLDTAEKLYDRAIQDAWNRDGYRGIAYTTDWEGNPVVNDRMHWTLAEAINTSSVLYQNGHNNKKAEEYSEYMKYLEEEVHDKVNGSWFHQLDGENKLLNTVWPGKSDLYHAFQATLIPYYPVDCSIAAAVKKKVDKAIDVVALGELLIDFTENGISAAGNPVLEANPGGAPCNVLAMLQKLDKETAFIGKVGKDNFGDFLEETVKAQGIDTRNLLRDDRVPTTLAFVHTAPDGDRSFSFYRNPGADMMLRREEVNKSLIAEAKLFHFGTLSMTDPEAEEATVEAINYARQSGKLISFDPNLRPLLWDSLDRAKEKMAYGFENCDILKIADDEILFFTGKASIEEAIDCFTAQYPNIGLICVTLGKEGSVAICGGERVKCAPFLREDTIETTGAGDTFMACVISYVLDNTEVFFGDETVPDENRITDQKAHLLKMLKFANAAAALITTRKGALRVMPERDEIEELLGQGR